MTIADYWAMSAGLSRLAALLRLRKTRVYITGKITGKLQLNDVVLNEMDTLLWDWEVPYQYVYGTGIIEWQTR